MVELPRCIDATLKYRRAYGDQSRAEVRAIQSQIYKMRAYEQRQLVQQAELAYMRAERARLEEIEQQKRHKREIERLKQLKVRERKEREE